MKNLYISDVTDIRIRGCPHQNLTSATKKGADADVCKAVEKFNLDDFFFIFDKQKVWDFWEIGIIFFIYGTKKYQKWQDIFTISGR